MKRRFICLSFMTDCSRLWFWVLEPNLQTHASKAKQLLLQVMLRLVVVLSALLRSGDSTKRQIRYQISSCQSGLQTHLEKVVYLNRFLHFLLWNYRRNRTDIMRTNRAQTMPVYVILCDCNAEHVLKLCWSNFIVLLQCDVVSTIQSRI